MGSSSSQLEKITEGLNTGWALLNRISANFGDIGNGAVDLTQNPGPTSNTIGATGDYPTIQDAITDLETQGVNDTVIMQIQTGTYNKQYCIHEISGTSDTSFVEFTSETGNADDVILSCDSSDYLLYLAGADYIHFSNLSFESDSVNKFVVIDSFLQFLGRIFQSFGVAAFAPPGGGISPSRVGGYGRVELRDAVISFSDCPVRSGHPGGRGIRRARRPPSRAGDPR